MKGRGQRHPGEPGGAGGTPRTVCGGAASGHREGAVLGASSQCGAGWERVGVSVPRVPLHPRVPLFGQGAPGCFPSRGLVLPKRGNEDFELPWADDVMGRGSSGDTRSSCPMLRSPSPSWLPARPSRRLCPTPEQGCNFTGTHACPPRLLRLPGREGRRARGGVCSAGKGCDHRLLRGVALNPVSACGPGPGGVLIQQISPGISTRRGPRELGAPPSLQALLGSAAQPWPEANTCAGQGLPTLGASGRAPGQAGRGGTGGHEVCPGRQPHRAGGRKDGMGWGPTLQPRALPDRASRRTLRGTGARDPPCCAGEPPI